MISFTVQLFYKDKSLYDIVHAKSNGFESFKKATTFFAESIMPSSFNISAAKDLSRFCQKKMQLFLKGKKCFCGREILNAVMESV